jgi:hypothetical protein
MALLRVPISVDGPVVDLGMWIPLAMRRALVAYGRPIPPPQTIRALIDTGANRTAIHPSALTLIVSSPTGTILVRRPGSPAAAARVDLHDLFESGRLPTADLHPFAFPIPQ